jgi:hypothetical protein
MSDTDSDEIYRGWIIRRKSYRRRQVQQDEAGTGAVLVSWPRDAYAYIDRMVDGETPPPEDPFLITSILPDEFPAGYPDTGGTVRGSGFEDGAVIVFGGADQATDFISDIQLNFTLPSSTSAEGPVQVSVRNPGGELTGEVTFTFIAPTRSRGKAA